MEFWAALVVRRLLRSMLWKWRYSSLLREAKARQAQVPQWPKAVVEFLNFCWAAFSEQGVPIIDCFCGLQTNEHPFRFLRGMEIKCSSLVSFGLDKGGLIPSLDSIYSNLLCLFTIGPRSCSLLVSVDNNMYYLKMLHP